MNIATIISYENYLTTAIKVEWSLKDIITVSLVLQILICHKSTLLTDSI